MKKIRIIIGVQGVGKSKLAADLTIGQTSKQERRAQSRKTPVFQSWNSNLYSRGGYLS